MKIPSKEPVVTPTFNISRDVQLKAMLNWSATACPALHFAFTEKARWNVYVLWILVFFKVILHLKKTKIYRTFTFQIAFSVNAKCKAGYAVTD